MAFDISTLSKGDYISDGQKHYKVYDAPYVENGIQLVSTTDMGDNVYVFSQGDLIWKEDPPWLVKAREISKARKG